MLGNHGRRLGLLLIFICFGSFENLIGFYLILGKEVRRVLGMMFQVSGHPSIRIEVGLHLWAELAYDDSRFWLASANALLPFTCTACSGAAS